METERLPPPNRKAFRLVRGARGRKGAEAPGPAWRADRLSWDATRESLAVTIILLDVIVCFLRLGGKWGV